MLCLFWFICSEQACCVSFLRALVLLYWGDISKTDSNCCSDMTCLCPVCGSETHIKKISKGAKIRNRYNRVPHLTKDTNGKVTNSQLDTTNESQEFSPFPSGDHKAQINRCAQRHNKHKTEKHKRSTKEVPHWNGQ